jgi:hypothetical protein
MKNMMVTFTAALVALVAGYAIAQGGYVPNARDTIPAQDCELITPSDTEPVRVTRLVTVGTSGTLRVRFNSGRTLTIPAIHVVSGWSAPIVINRVYASGTTAQDIMVCR